MKRRDFLIYSVSTAGSLLPGVSIAARPCSPGSLSVVGGNSTSRSCGSDVEGDWIARSTAAGVLWAHDFRNDWEVDWFRINDGNDPGATQVGGGAYGAYSGAYVVGTDSSAVFRDTSDGTTGGACLTLRVHPRYTTLTKAVELPTASAYVPEISFADSLPVPPNGWKFDKETRVMLETPDRTAFEIVDLVSHIAQNRQFGIARGAEQQFGSTVREWPAGTRVIIPGHSSPSWNRPFSPLRYGNSSYGQDAGYNVGDPRGPIFDPLYGKGTQGWNWGYLRNPSEQIGTATGGYSTDLATSELYIQIRLKITGRGRPRPFTPAVGKLFYIDRAAGPVSAQEIIIRSSRSGMLESYNGLQSPSMTYPQGNPTYYSPARGMAKDKRWQPDGEWGSTCLEATQPSGCFVWPDGQWVTFLIHIKPGISPQRADLTSLRQSLDQTSSSTVQTIAVTNAAAMPAFLKNIRESAYWVRIGPSEGEFCKVIAVDVANNSITIERGNNFNSLASTTSHAAGEPIYMSAVQQLYAWYWPEGRDWRSVWEWKVAYEGDAEYRTVFARPDMMLFMGSIGEQLGWNRINLSGYHNGYGSYSEWSHKIDQIICSTRPIPCPRP